MTYKHLQCFSGVVNYLYFPTPLLVHGGREYFPPLKWSNGMARFAYEQLLEFHCPPPVNNDHSLGAVFLSERNVNELSEETAHPTVYHHLSQLSVDIQLSGLIKCSQDSRVLRQLTQVVFRSLSWISHESAAIRQWTQVIYS